MTDVIEGLSAAKASLTDEPDVSSLPAPAEAPTEPRTIRLPTDLAALLSDRALAREAVRLIYRHDMPVREFTSRFNAVFKALRTTPA